MDSSTPAPDSNQRVDRKFSPRFWLGCEFFAWLRIMTRGRFEFNLPHLHIGLCATITSFAHTFLKFAQNSLYRKEIERTKIDKAPIFIIGHWRTGTTLLHELMILDSRHSFPNTYQCLEPNHFLLTEKLFKRWFTFLLPKHRPMDNMQVGWEKPQEDEFALCMLGQPSPYLDIIFPNRPSMTPGALDLETLTPSERRNWKRTFYRFLQTLTFHDSRRLILKSPPHSCRISTLLELFPDARFVHIVRNPYKVYPSTVKLWKSLAEKHGVQTPHHRDVEAKVLSTFTHLYKKVEEGKKLVSPSRFHELRYEDLIRDPIGEMRLLYERLEIGEFGNYQPRLTEYLASHANYETNKFQLTPAEQQTVTNRWGDVISHYGYAIEPAQNVTFPLRVHQHSEGDETSKSPDVLAFPQSTRASMTAG